MKEVPEIECALCGLQDLILQDWGEPALPPNRLGAIANAILCDRQEIEKASLLMSKGGIL